MKAASGRAQGRRVTTSSARVTTGPAPPVSLTDTSHPVVAGEGPNDGLPHRRPPSGRSRELPRAEQVDTGVASEPDAAAQAPVAGMNQEEDAIRLAQRPARVVRVIEHRPGGDGAEAPVGDGE